MIENGRLPAANPLSARHPQPRAQVREHFGRRWNWHCSVIPLELIEQGLPDPTPIRIFDRIERRAAVERRQWYCDPWRTQQAQEMLESLTRTHGNLKHHLTRNTIDAYSWPAQVRCLAGSLESRWPMCVLTARISPSTSQGPQSIAWLQSCAVASASARKCSCTGRNRHSSSAMITLAERALQKEMVEAVVMGKVPATLTKRSSAGARHRRTAAAGILLSHDPSAVA